MTVGMSDTTFHFLKEASKKREFQVVVAEGCPRFDGHPMAKKLAEAGIHTTLIADSAVFAMMARANKVWLRGMMRGTRMTVRDHSSHPSMFIHFP